LDFQGQGRPRGGVSLKPLRKRLLWFFGLWLAGVAAIAAVGYLIRLIIAP
jgi:preprotein translocase subunit Sss1